MKSLVSIIIPLHNREKLILETLSSIINQAYENWECIVVDDGSTDNSFEVVTAFAKAESKIKICKRPEQLHKGAPSCRNYGFELSTGEFVKFLDSDDLLTSESLSLPLKYLELNKNLDFISSQWEYFDESEVRTKNYLYKNVKGDRIKALLMQDHYFITSVPIWRKDFLNDKKLFDPQLIRAQEADFNFRRLLEKPNYIILPDFLLKIRTGHMNISSNSQLNIEYKISVIEYMSRVMDYLLENEKQHDAQCREYMLMRYLTTFYEIKNHGKANYYYKKAHIYVDTIKVSLKLKMQFKLGLYTSKNFNKGYQLLHYKKFNYRDSSLIEYN